MCVETPHGDPLQRESKRKQRQTSSRVTCHQNVIGEADDRQMEAPTSNPFCQTLRVGLGGQHAAICRNVVRTRSVASLSIKGRWACHQAPHTRPRIPNWLPASSGTYGIKTDSIPAVKGQENFFWGAAGGPSSRVFPAKKPGGVHLKIHTRP